MRILLFGAEGQVGNALYESLAEYQVIALGRKGDGELVGDLEDQAGIQRTIRTIRPQIVINAAAYTNVDGAEANPETARKINAEAPRAMAEAARGIGARLIHYSTDYVFDGSGDHPWKEEDPTGPLNVYGHTKLEGENALKEVGGDYLVLRVSWVHHETGKNFIGTILRLAKERDRLDVVADQIGAPTSARLIARITKELVEHHPHVGGIYHLAPQGETSWCEYARYVVQEARRNGWATRLSPDSIHPTTTEAFGAPAPRPKNSRLNTSRLQELLALSLPNWKEDVRETLMHCIEAGERRSAS